MSHVQDPTNARMSSVESPAEERGQVRSRRRNRRSRHKARALRWIGAAMLLAGVGLLGYVAWQFWGTNWVSEQRQGEVTAALEEGWSSDQDSVSTDFGVVGAILAVPRFGEEYRMPILEGDDDEVLAAGVGHLTDTARAGEVGNYVISAHRVTHGEPFANLPDLRAGDEVEIRTRTATYIYVLDTGGGPTWSSRSQPRGSWTRAPPTRNPTGFHPRGRWGSD